jgi:hypothetical protein
MIRWLSAALPVFSLAGCSAEPPSAGEPIASAEQALANGSAGFVWSRFLSTSGPADAPWSYNSSGGTNQITKLAGVGEYRVDFPGLGGTFDGNVQVTGYGTGNERCKVRNWSSSGSNLQVFVNCYSATGSPRNAQFTANFVRRTGTPGAEGGYVWAWNQSSPSYDPATAYQWNSTGGGIHIDHFPAGSGFYRVFFNGAMAAGGTVEVTAYGSSNSYCVTVGSNAQYVDVLCFDGAGNSAESQFTLIYSTKSPNNTPAYTYAWADRATATAPYNPRPDYEHGVLPSDCGEVVMPNATVTRSPVGRYEVRLPGMASIMRDPSNVKVTAVSSTSNTCKVRTWHQSGTDGIVSVNCYDRFGSPVDAEFMITYSSFAFTVC